MLDLLMTLPLALLAAAVVLLLPPARATTLALPPAPDLQPVLTEPKPRPKRQTLPLIDRYSRLQLLEMATQLDVGTPDWRRKASKARLYAALMRVGVAHG
jgi:hypothetical protein